MRFKTVMISKAVVCLGFGLMLLFVPKLLLDILGTSYGSGAALTARTYGAALIGMLFLTWLARNAEDSVARRAIIWHLFVYDAIGFVVALVIQLTGGMSVLGWGIVAVYLFFTVGFGYHLLPQRKAS
jgi:hypothetical protein